MKKSKNDQILLIPGSSGWDLWSLQAKEAQRIKETEEELALEIDKIPSSKNFCMAFPVCELTALELWNPNADDDATADLINLQIERMGLAQSDELGVLIQYSPLTSSNPEKSLYSIDVLRAPAEGTLPTTSPSQFNVSPRCFQHASNSVTLWKEFGKWVMSVSNTSSEVVHYQGLTTKTLEAASVQEINLTLTQLQQQQIIASSPERFIIWTEEVGIRPEGIEQLESRLGAKLVLEEKPPPTFPMDGTLLPADTRAERILAKQKRNQNIIGSLAALLLIGFIAFAAYRLIDLEKRASYAADEALQLTQQNQALLDHTDKWNELTVLTTTENTPLTLLRESASIIPNRELRFRRAEFLHEPSEDGTATKLTIYIEGEAPNSDIALDFDERLQKHKPFQTLTWTNQAPTKSQTGWKFSYRAEQL